MWTWNEALLWMIVHLLQVIDQRLVWHKGAKGANPKMPKWRDYPWVDGPRDRAKKKLGDRGDMTNDEVEAWLDTIRPPQPNA